jgi:hypothetical protein
LIDAPARQFLDPFVREAFHGGNDRPVVPLDRRERVLVRRAFFVRASLVSARRSLTGLDQTPIAGVTRRGDLVRGACFGGADQILEACLDREQLSQPLIGARLLRVFLVRVVSHP